MTHQVDTQEIENQRDFTYKVKNLFSSMEQMPLAFVHSFGCQQNVSDGEKLKGMIAQMGYGFTDSPEKADLVVYNTCAVRENAEDRVFGNIGALKNVKAERKSMQIAVCGCMVQQEHIADKIKKSFPYVNMVFGTHVLHTFPEILYKSIESGKREFVIENSDGVIAEGIPLRRESKYKASVPIMYGCNNFCTYCIVPYVRGRERSRKAEDILNEVKSLVSEGYKEILLLGQNVNSYGKEIGVSFAQLLHMINDIDGEFRIDFMTSHPKDCSKELINTIAECEKVVHHLHLPVQSGSNRILKLMNRGYTREQYTELVGYAKKKISDLFLTTDIIVGFPGETYEDFLETKSLVRQAEIDSAFTFIYSRRVGTKAAEMDDPISDEEKGKWFRELLESMNSGSKNKNDRFVGTTMRVLCDGIGRIKDGYYTGKSDNGFIVDFDGCEKHIGTFVNVEITEALSWALVGKITETK